MRWNPVFDSFCQAGNCGRLGEARYAFNQQVPVTQQADQHPLNQVLLSDDDLTDFIDQCLKGNTAMFDLSGEFVDPVVKLVFAGKFSDWLGTIAIGSLWNC